MIAAERPGAGTSRPAVFLDRDGTLHREQSFITERGVAVPLPGVRDALHTLKDAGFVLVVTTNQSAVARGMLTEAGLAAIHWDLHRALDRTVTAWLHAPWHPDGGHGYGGEHPDRKPGAGMLHRAARWFDLDLHRSVVVGDSARDVQAAADMPVHSVLVRSGKPWREQVAKLAAQGIAPDHIADDLPAAVPWILSHCGSGGARA